MPIRTEKATVVAEDGRRLLSEVSCAFGSGELTLLVGANGAGKSTLLDVLSGLTACEGTVELDGVPIRDGRRLNREAAYRIGRQFQYPESQLFAATVQKEFDYSLGYMKLPDDENRTRTDRAMSEMGLADSLKAESPLVLSGGEKRRVAIATTLAADPDWLLLDEPTAGLDPEAASRLVSALLSRKGRPSGGIIAATHDLDLLLPAADRVVVLREGGVIADMPASELALRPDVWDRAGIGRPASAELAGQLRLLGLPVPAKFLAPEEAADLIAGRLRAAGGRPSLETDAYGEPPGEGAAAQPGAALARDRVPEQDRERGSGRIAGSPKRFVESLDPRAKWLFMMTFSIGVLIQRDWLGFGLGAIAAAALLLLCRVPARHIVPLMRPFLWFAAASVAVSGLGIGEAGSAASSSGGAWESGAGGGLYPLSGRSGGADRLLAAPLHPGAAAGSRQVQPDRPLARQAGEAQRSDPAARSACDDRAAADVAAADGDGPDRLDGSARLYPDGAAPHLRRAARHEPPGLGRGGDRAGRRRNFCRYLHRVRRRWPPAAEATQFPGVFSSNSHGPRTTVRISVT
ncbi:MAG: hypothetical protein K0Q94_3344 [Paenibacillus sp.]|nr:hypothetical protein [Paenibacillus sp.]